MPVVLVCIVAMIVSTGSVIMVVTMVMPTIVVIVVFLLQEMGVNV
jgi:hypothetical protein